MLLLHTWSSMQQVCVGSGFLLGSLTAAMLTIWIDPDNMPAWGWGIPFLLGVLAGAIGGIMRWRSDGTPNSRNSRVPGRLPALR